MKKLITTYVLMFLCAFMVYSNPIDTLELKTQVLLFENEVNEINRGFDQQINELKTELLLTNQEIKKAKIKGDYEALLFALEKKISLKDEIESSEAEKGLKLAQLRYKKGLNLIKLLYEKVLGLDHHFSSLQTFNNVFQLTNPNNYPEFKRSQEDISKKLKKKNSFKFPNILQANSYLSAAFTLFSVFSNDDSSKEKEADLDNLSCIMDFTIKMNNELNTIYYETEFLKNGNDALKKQVSTLFEEYVKVIDYKSSIDKCRRTDDWEVVYESLENFVRDLEEKKKKNDPLYDQMIFKGHVDLEFSVDRFLAFLEKYNDFIAQGGKYYEKFRIIINNYDNEEVCVRQLPHQFSGLKKDIDISISKFNEAYNIAELRGSKLKDLLYGLTN